MIAKNAERLLLSMLETPYMGKPLVLVGGTALSLQLSHRESYDLDLAWMAPRPATLDRKLFGNLISLLETKGHSVVDTTDFATMQEWENDGFDLKDSQQDFLIDDVAVTFFVPQFSPNETEAAKRRQFGHLDIATPLEIFWMKAGITAERFRARDAFDLSVMMERFGYGLDEYLQGLHHRNYAHAAQTALNRLAACRPPPGDPGISEHIDFQELRPALMQKFEALRDEYEIRIANAVIHNSSGPGF